MAAFLLHLLLVSVIGGITARTDLLRPPPVTFAADVPTAEAAPPPPAPELKPDPEVKPPRKLDPSNVGVKLTAPMAALVDTRSGEVLFSKGDDRVAPIASITKLMTALVILDAKPDWEQPITVEVADNANEGIPYLKPGDTLSTRDLFQVMLVGSANNAAMALSRSLGMTREAFVGRMNAKARSLGLIHTTFTDPTGYEPQNVSAPLEVARLAYAALSHPEIEQALTEQRIKVRTARGLSRDVPATDELLGTFLNKGDFHVVGGKTGFTDEAGYALVSRVKKGDADVIAVTLGSASSADRFQDAKSLVYWGFQAYEWP